VQNHDGHPLPESHQDLARAWLMYTAMMVSLPDFLTNSGNSNRDISSPFHLLGDMIQFLD
jgi:hypothetical protein